MEQMEDNGHIVAPAMKPANCKWISHRIDVPTANLSCSTSYCLLKPLDIFPGISSTRSHSQVSSLWAHLHVLSTAKLSGDEEREASGEIS